MVSINIRELSHNLANYLKKVKAGQRITILERNVPIADVVPHNKNLIQPGWKRKIKKIEVKNGVSLSKAVIKERREAKY